MSAFSALSAGDALASAMAGSVEIGAAEYKDGGCRLAEYPQNPRKPPFFWDFSA
jgi:hypothetical protein